MIVRFARAVGRTSRLAVTSGGVLRELGPHAAIALILPGGSLIALAMWTLRRHRAWFTPSLRRMLVVAAAVGASLILPGNL
jgi:hypothetical protein